MIRYLKEQCTVDGELHRGLFLFALCLFVFSPIMLFFSIATNPESNIIQMCVEALIGIGVILAFRIPLFNMIKSDIGSLSNRFLLFGCIISILFT